MLNNQKGSAPILIIIGVFLVALVILKNNNVTVPGISDRGEQSEDEASLYTIPPDVLSALNQAKQSGNPVLGIRADGPSYHIPILMYHYVEYVQDKNDKMRISLNTPPEILDNEINTLVQAGYTFITTSDLANILDNIEEMPTKPVILAFDDGYRDFYTDAFPILRKYNVRSVAYIISGFLNGTNYMTDEELTEIAKSGLVEIGAHTVHHLALAGLPANKVRDEVAGSKIALEQKLGIPITAFAYPYGSFDLGAIQAVKQAGYRTAVSTLPGTEASNSVRLFAFRLRPGGRTGQDLLKLLQ